MKGNRTAALAAIFLFTVLLTVKCCPQGWLSYKDQCIYINQSKTSFNNAHLRCLLLHRGYLLSVSSEKMFEFLSIHTYSYRDTKFWVNSNEPATSDHPWVHRIGPLSEDCFMYTGSVIEKDSCLAQHGYICSQNKTIYNPTEKCLEGLTEHSFVGEMSGNCFFRTPVATTREDADAKCTEHGGRFAELSEILSDGVSSFVDHKVMVNDSFRYWTHLTVNGSRVDMPPVDLFANTTILLPPGKGDCVTVSFFVHDAVRAELFQAECNDHAYVICAAPSSTPPTTTFAAPLQQQLLSCPMGQNWKVYPLTNDCFWETSFETSRLSWYDARKYCQAYGGDLASFHNQDEEKIGLSFQYGSLSHPYWIGLYLDKDTETYKWSDGSPLDYTNWAPGHPNHRDKRLRCVAMDADETHWISSLCGIVSWFVCKAPKRANPPTPLFPTREPLVPCDSSSLVPRIFYYQGYCYEVGSNLYSWHRAKEYCENKDSSLVSVHTDDEIGFLLRLLYDNRQTVGNRVWIGLNSLVRGTFRWTDYTPVDFTYWNVEEPNNKENQEKCVNMYIGNGLWNDENCNIHMSYICKYNKDANVTIEIPTTRDPSIGNCKKGWYAHHDRCYLLAGLADKDKVNWTVASQNCQLLGGYLVSIRSAGEQAYLSYLMQSLKDNVWIGLHDTLQSGRYFWVDSSDIRYTNWAPGEPSFFGIQEDCVKMVHNDVFSGVWRDDECNKKLPYICHMDKDPDLPKPEYNRGLDCIHPQGWLKLENMCFKMFAGNPLTWQEAESACQRQGAHLVSLFGTSVQAISTYLGMEVNQTYWIGLKYEKSSEQFRWLNGWPMTISRWGVNEPSGMERGLCYSSSPDGFWKGVPCTEELPFICQITAGNPPVKKSYTGDCPTTSDLWVPTEGSYCHIYENGRADWFSANLRCFRHGSYLISIHSLDELEQVRKTMKPGIQSVLIGLMRTEIGGFSWTDQSPVDFVNWEEGEPQKNDDNCVAMMADSLKWRIVPCLGKTHVLCSTKKVNEVDEVPESSKYSTASTSGLSTGVLAAILTCSILVLVVIILGAVYLRRPLGRSRFRNPFRQHSVSYENALYNVDSASMEFQEDDGR
ncbi:secretory phospholipase A2 receptor [Caerostris extrusa]|uniref:Secretory phospholipase A2 receptor n=1 Tax=Caerostris extrusa TaxID=172846 RepID=A0AAV4PLX8_CAEEX|nr:secretory phospholipase A2 receptor [Caerostris extrusa]